MFVKSDSACSKSRMFLAVFTSGPTPPKVKFIVFC
jgi:hypothetical protein